MARPTSIRDEDILVAARQTFLERGIRATSAEVAERAGVSEGSVFKRFPSKEELFHAALRVDMEAAVAFTEGLASRAGRGEVRAHLVELGGELLTMFRLVLPVMMMRWSNPGCRFASQGEAAPPPVRLLAALRRYLLAESELGRLAPIDVDVLARSFVGAIQNLAFLEVLTREPDATRMPARTYVARLVDSLWLGCAPRPAKARSRRAPAGTRRPARA